MSYTEDSGSNKLPIIFDSAKRRRKNKNWPNTYVAFQIANTVQNQKKTNNKVKCVKKLQ